MSQPSVYVSPDETVPEGPAPVVEMLDVTRTFSGPPEVDVLRDVQLTIGVGEYISIVGSSGSGKSTLLNLVGLLDTPTSGIYRFDGIDTIEMTDRERTGLRGQRIGFVFQAFHLLSHRTAVENVELADLYTGHAANRRQEAIDALEAVGLAHRLHAYPTTLSGGESQRVAIARALMGNPSLLLADEPTGNVDTTTSSAILDVFDELHSEGLTLAVITHDPTVAQRAERRVSMSDGRTGQVE